MSKSKLLVRQLSRLGLNYSEPPSPDLWKKLLRVVDSAYVSHDEDRYLLERALTLSSEEMQERWNSLQFSQQIHAAILNSALNSIVTVDGDWLILEFNAAAETTFGRKRADVVGKSIFGTIFPKTVEAILSPQVEAIKESEIRHSPEDLTGLRVDGSEFPIKMSFSVVKYEGELIIPIFVRDLTEQHMMERLVAEEQAKAMTATKFASLGQMAGGIAHEINNPLAVIQTLAGQMQDLLSDGEFDQKLFNELTAEVINTSQRIAKIVSGLRSFSRDGSKDPSQPVNLAEVIEETLPFCRMRLNQSQILLKVEKCPPDLYFSGRTVEVSQVLLNLLNNACDAIDKLDERWIHLDVKVDEKWLELSITDSGYGVSAAYRDKLFQPFFTTKEIGRGTGIGLSISKSIIENHGGDLLYDKNSPRTRFVVKLPRLEIGSCAAA